MNTEFPSWLKFATKTSEDEEKVIEENIRHLKSEEYQKALFGGFLKDSREWRWKYRGIPQHTLMTTWVNYDDDANIVEFGPITKSLSQSTTHQRIVVTHLAASNSRKVNLGHQVVEIDFELKMPTETYLQKISILKAFNRFNLDESIIHNSPVVLDVFNPRGEWIYK